MPIQLDEIRTRLRKRVHGVWLWLARDPISKLIPVLHLGARTQDATYIVVHALRQRLAPDCLPVFTSDGLNQDFYALTAHFGQWVDGVGRRARHWQVAAGLLYGHVKKRYRRRRLIGVRYMLRCGTRTTLRAALQGLGLSGRLNTAFVERLKKDGPAKRGGPHPPNLVDHARGATAVAPPGMVAGLLPFRAPPQVAPGAAGAAP